MAAVENAGGTGRVSVGKLLYGVLAGILAVVVWALTMLAPKRG